MSANQDAVVFLSYRTADSPSASELIYSELSRALQIRIFKDSDCIEIGQPISQAVQDNLGRAKVLLLVIGPRWFDLPDDSVQPAIFLENDWVFWEIKTALDKRIPIVPLYVEGAKRLRAKDLPRDIQAIADISPNGPGLAPRDVVIGTDRTARDLLELAKGLATSLELPLKSTSDSSVAASSWRPSRDWQLRHLERLQDELGRLRPAIPPRGTQQQEWRLSAVFVPLELQGAQGALTEGTIDWIRILRNERVALTGRPGAGKSTLLRHLVLSAVEQRRARLTRRTGDATTEVGTMNPLSRIPVWMNLPTAARQIREGKERGGGQGPTLNPEVPNSQTRTKWFKDLTAEDWLNAIARTVQLGGREQAKGLLDTGEVLFVFDGLDEIADSEERRYLVESLSKLPNACETLGERNPVVVGCREKAWERGGPFIPFDVVQIQPMSQRKWEEYFERWCRAVWDERADGVLENLRQSLGRSSAVREMATNPQTATMLAVLAREGRLPEQRVRLYDQFLTFALDNDRMERYGDPSEARGHLIALALELQNRTTSAGDSGTSFSENLARSILGRRLFAEKAAGLNESQIRARGKPLLEDIELHTGLISIDRSDGPNSVRAEVGFRHRMVQEFLVACYYADHPDAILDHTTEPAWLVPIALTAGLLAKNDDEDVLEEFLRRLSEHPSAEAARSKLALVEWGQRVAVLSACLEELAGWELPKKTLAPARQVHERAGKVLMEFDVGSRLAIAQGMGILGDPRLSLAAASRWVEIDACSSLVGSDSDEAWEQEQPVREVRLSSYWIQRWPVTVQEYARFVEAEHGYSNDQWWGPGLRWRNEHRAEMPEGWERMRVFGNRPVTGVSWWEARAYTRWLTAIEALPEGWVATLPTDAQWERAARGPFESGVHRAGRFPWGAEWDGEVERANCHQITNQVCPVGLFPRGNSPEGLWDLAGNVGERCLDGFGPPKPSDAPDPCHADYRFGHVVRGGDYASSVLNARVSARFPASLDARSESIGFRCVAWRAPEFLR